jgi:Glycosyltransferase 61
MLVRDYTLFADAVIYSTILSESAFVAVPLKAELRDRLKARLNLKPCTPFRRLFVSRRDTPKRPVANTDEVESYFSAPRL